MKIRLSILVLLVSMMGIMPSLAQNSPEGVVSAFLDAWNEADYERMYGYIHTQSQDAYPQQVFQNRLASMQQVTSMTGLSYTIRNTQQQGESAAVLYDLVLESSRFDAIEDPGRIMRLLNTPNGWRIAWSTMDIFDAMAGDAQLSPQSQSRRRATIYDRDGDILATDGQTTVALYTTRARMSSEDGCINLVASITRQPVIRFQRRFAENLPETLFFLVEMPTDIYEQHSGQLLNTCGVGVGGADVATSQPQRVYYGGNAVSHVTGYVGPIPAEQEADYIARGYGSGSMVGLAGVEATFEETLAGRPESVLRIVDSGGTVLRELAGTTGTETASVTLTVDRDLQLIVSQAIADAYNYASGNWGAVGVSSGAAAVVLDVNTGAIRALVSYPLFDPVVFSPSSVTPNRDTAISQALPGLTNRATQEQYAPGSVFKIITGAAVLNENVVGLDDIFECELYWNGTSLGDTMTRRPDWRVADEMDAAGPVTPAQALSASCNPFFWEYGALLYRRGPEKLSEYARRMGMARVYGIEGLREVPGVIPVPPSADMAINESVGQGDVAIPPIQMAVVTASVANGGTVYKPYLVQQIGGMDGTPVTFTAQPEVLTEFDFEPGVVETLQEGMCNAVTDPRLGTAYGRFSSSGPTGYSDLTASYTACGKTGTAETARYPNAWFVAYAPAVNPEIAIVVMVDQSREGSQIAAPIVRRILDDYFGQQRASYPEWWNNEPYIPLVRPEGGGLG